MIGRLLGGLGVCVCVLATVSLAQDDRRAAPREGREFESPRERIETELERVRATEARLERALKMIDEGATPQDVRRMMRDGDRRGDRMGRGRRPGPEGRPAHEPLTDEERRRALDEIERVAPLMGERLRGLAERRPAAADAMIQRMRGRLAELRELREKDPEMAEIKLAEFRSGLKISRATQEFRAVVREHGVESPEAERKREALRAALGEGVDVRLRFHQAEVARLERRIEKARAELAERRENRDAFIEERIVEMVDQIDTNGAAGDLPLRD